MNRALAIILAIGCGGPAAPPVKPTSDLVTADTDLQRRQRMLGELEDDIRASYDRDDAPDTDTLRIDPRVGPSRIGVGPADVLYGDDIKTHPVVRWPLDVAPGTPTVARSKHLDVHLASDRGVSAAWMADELSWRVTLCGRTAVIPLRITALYAHDGDRWVEVFEHLSFGDVPHATPELAGTRMRSVVSSRALADDLSRALTPLLYRESDRLPSVLALDPTHAIEEDVEQPAPTFLLAPDPDGEWHGTDDISRAQIVDGVLNPDDRRIGIVGGSLDTATIAYWVGNFIATLPDRPGIKGGRVRLRGTFVFEKRPACKNGQCPRAGTVDCATDHSCHWVIAQGHVSQPIDDDELAQRVFGTALLSVSPLQLTCDEATPSIPAAEPPPNQTSPPAAHSP
ncbi:MAG TPA: hypothetical protein VH143_02505 [Kofleriaceae bacterium]|nr:hypothetical protein [Kofleriaceae bacterium]